MQQQLNNNYLKDDNSLEGYDFSKFSKLKDYILDDSLKAKFAPIAKKLSLSQESVDMLLDIALEMSEKQRAKYEKDDKEKQNETITSYSELFDSDNEIPKNNQNKLQEYMQIANRAYSQFSSNELKQLLSQTGLIYHPEMIKLFFKIGELAQEDNILHFGQPKTEELTPAQILYGKTAYQK